jgi:hypothetical protein
VGVRLADKLPLRRSPSGAALDDAARDGGEPGTVSRGREALGAALHDGRVRGAIALVVVIVLVVLLTGSGGTTVTPPATGAAAIVPSNALAYVHLSTDATRSSVNDALTLARGFPSYATLRNDVIAQLDLTSPRSALDYGRDVRPWLGKEAALAFIDTGTATPAPLVVLAVANQRAAERFVAGLPVHGTATYNGTTMTGHPGADATAFIGDYLVIGHGAAIRAAIDAASGRSPSLSHDATYRRATAAEPAGRVVDGYVTGAGMVSLLARRGGLIGTIGSLLYQPALRGMAIALTPATGGLRVFVRSVDSGRSGSVPFTPSFGGLVPSGATMFLDVTGLNSLLPRLLTTTGILGRIPELLKRLGAALTAKGIDVQRDIDSLFRRESAVVISTHAGAPVVTVIARTPDPNQTRTVFAQLEQPLAQLFAAAGSAAGQAPIFNQVQAGGITAHQIVLSPGLQLDYAVSGSDLLLSTSLSGIAAVGHHASSIVDDPAYRTVLGDHPASVTSLLFLDLNQLLRLGEQTGLISGAGLRALQPDLERVHAIGMDSTSGENESTAELFLQIP